MEYEVTATEGSPGHTAYCGPAGPTSLILSLQCCVHTVNTGITTSSWGGGVSSFLPPPSSFLNYNLKRVLDLP